MHLDRRGMTGASVVLSLALCFIVTGAQAAETVEELEVTATRIPEPVDQVPADITVIKGEELRARGATDLRTALSLVAGVEAPPGGDTGPAGAVPSFWGLHEFDAFLLVVDGVPWGGAFNPSIPTLNLNDVERIEVLKGSAPVIYGATSFVGVVQVIHYPAGQAADEAQIGYGSHGSVQAHASTALPAIGGLQQSIAVDGERLGYSDAREQIGNGHILYRGAGTVAGGELRLDADITLQRQAPPSPVVRQGAGLTTLTPLDANYNPADAGIDENRYHLALGYSHATSLGLWDTTASFARADTTDIRGFLRSSLTNDGSQNADSQNQDRKVLDTYFDTHFSTELVPQVDLVYGADLLYGLGKQASINGAYFVPLTGVIAVPRTTDLHIDEINSVSDQRAFLGEYAEVDWKPDAQWDLTTGLRFNETYERRISRHIDGFDPSADVSAEASKHQIRPAGTIGLSYRVWQNGADEASVYADYRNAFKPAAIDFGPDFTPNVLNPETAQSYEAGLKGAVFGGRLGYQAEFFLLNFKNLVVATIDENGNPLMQNAGGERLKGVETALRYHLSGDLSLAASVSYHDARFTEFVANEGGANINVEGRQLTLSPRILGSYGVIYAPALGFNASAVATYVGRRFLDLANTASTPGYTSFDGSIGYRFGRYSITLNGYNLSDERPPVTQSEFGDQSFYLLPGRTLFLNTGISF
jgi:outer membrane receptor protein involved in Fe transport